MILIIIIIQIIPCLHAESSLLSPPSDLFIITSTSSELTLALEQVTSVNCLFLFVQTKKKSDKKHSLVFFLLISHSILVSFCCYICLIFIFSLSHCRVWNSAYCLMSRNFKVLIKIIDMTPIAECKFIITSNT